jgi:hypothetical protein
MHALPWGILNRNHSYFPFNKYNTNKFMVEIYFFVTIINTSPLLDWLLRVTVPIDAVTSLNERDAILFLSITQMSQI